MIIRMASLAVTAMMILGCDPVGKVTYQIRVSDSEDGTRLANVCVSTHHEADPRDFTGRTDIEGIVNAEHVFLLPGEPPPVTLAVQLVDGVRQEDIAIEGELGAVGNGDIFRIEIMSIEVDRFDLETDQSGCE